MSAAIAMLAGFAVAGAITAALRSRPARRPVPDRGIHDESSRDRPHRRLLPRLRRPPQGIRPAALAAWADDLARSLRHGSTLHAALSNTLPDDAVIERRSASLRHWLGRGATVAEACDEWSDELSQVAHVPQRGGRRHRGRERVDLLATMAAVVSATASLGGAAAAPLDRFAVSMRQRASDDLERAAHSAQAKMSAKVLTSVPLAVLALMLLTDADVRAVVLSATGGALVAVGIGLNALGALWMRRIAVGNDRGAPC